jgi:alpha-amylase
MGYDPYDYYDLGEFDQKGGVPTWFGSKAELLDLIESAHALGLQAYADLVFNHNSGADAQEPNPIDGQLRWTKFTPKSGKFPRDWKCFHPSQYETWDGVTFGDMPDLCHRTPFVYTEQLCALAVGRNRLRWVPLRHGQGLRRLDGPLDSGTPRTARWHQFQAVCGR